MHGYKRLGMIALASLMAYVLWGCAARQQVEVAPTTTATTRSEVPQVVAPVPKSTDSRPLPPTEAKKAPTAAAKIVDAPKTESADCYRLRGADSKKGGRCEPQSLPYARCRSGIMSCRIGKENGPLTWFACERKRGNTGNEPGPGSILVLAANKRRGMPTGHIMYVEEVLLLTPTTYKLILSHTNYDRKCSLETNIEALYDRAAMSLDIKTGAWQAWGHGLKLAGFIRD